MKKVFLFLLSFMFSTSFAGGNYDGIWSTPHGAVTINEHNGVIGMQLLAPIYEESVKGYVGVDWVFFTGNLKGNEVRITSIPVIQNSDISTYDIIFDSESTLRGTLRSCEPSDLCEDLLPHLNKEFTGKKIW